MNIHLLNKLVNSLLPEQQQIKQQQPQTLAFRCTGNLTEEIVTKTTPSQNPLFILFHQGHISPICIFKKIQIVPQYKKAQVTLSLFKHEFR